MTCRTHLGRYDPVLPPRASERLSDLLSPTQPTVCCLAQMTLPTSSKAPFPTAILRSCHTDRTVRAAINNPRTQPLA